MKLKPAYGYVKSYHNGGRPFMVVSSVRGNKFQVGREFGHSCKDQPIVRVKITPVRNTK